MSTKKKVGDYLIPFDKNGNQLDYAEGRWGISKEISMLQNFEFTDTLKFQRYGRGRSSVNFTFVRQSNNKTVSFFVSDFCDALPKLNGGEITGVFTFTKKGMNYGCKLIEN